MVGDACLTVSLAGSIFFTQRVGQSRTQVLLYLLLTIAPFAVVGPGHRPGARPEPGRPPDADGDRLLRAGRSSAS